MSVLFESSLLRCSDLHFAALKAGVRMMEVLADAELEG